MSRHKFRDILHILLVSSLSFLSYLVLYRFRELDNNSLTGWYYIFSDSFFDESGFSLDIVQVVAGYFFGIILIYLLSLSVVVEKYSKTFLFLLSFLLTLPLWSAPEIIVDVSRYFVQAKNLSLYGIGYFFSEWGNEINAWTDQFLWPLFFGLVFKFFGESRFVIQLFNTVIFSGSVVFTFEIGKILWNKETGFLGALFLLGIPYLFTQVPVVMVDVPTMFLVFLSLLLFLKSLKYGTWGLYLATAIAIVLASFSKYSAPVLLIVVIIAVFAFQEQGLRANLVKSSKILLVCLLLTGIILFFKFDVIMEQVKFIKSFQLGGLKRWGANYFSTFFFQIHPFITIFAILSVPLAWKNRDKKYIIIFWFVILVFSLELRRIRYALPLFPLLALMAAYGLAWIKDQNLKRYWAYTTVLTAFLINIYISLPFLRMNSGTNLMKAGFYLDTLEGEWARVYILTKKEYVANIEIALPMLDLYTDKKLYYERKKIEIDHKKIEKSRLRFTWNIDIPKFYTERPHEPGVPIVVITGEEDQKIPEEIIRQTRGYKNIKKYFTNTGVYNYNSFVIVYSREK